MFESLDQTGKRRGKLVELNIDRRLPALKNITTFLNSTGKLPEIRRGQVVRIDQGKRVSEIERDCRVYWCQIETELSEDEWYSLQEVEAAIPLDRFTYFTASIRHRIGSAYIEACDAFAKTIRVTDREFIGYQPPNSSGFHRLPSRI